MIHNIWAQLGTEVQGSVTGGFHSIHVQGTPALPAPTTQNSSDGARQITREEKNEEKKDPSKRVPGELGKCSKIIIIICIHLSSTKKKKFKAEKPSLAWSFFFFSLVPGGGRGGWVGFSK